jgi:hypothetical protein
VEALCKKKKKRRRLLLLLHHSLLPLLMHHTQLSMWKPQARRKRRRLQHHRLLPLVTKMIDRLIVLSCFYLNPYCIVSLSVFVDLILLYLILSCPALFPELEREKAVLAEDAANVLST